MRISKRKEESNEMRFFLNPFFYLLILLLTSCRSEIQEFPGNAGAIEIKNGKRFIISLNENHAKGENWLPVSGSYNNKISYIGSNYHGTQSGKTDFIFSAEAIGNTEIQFNLLAYGEVIRNQKIKVLVK